MEIKDKRGSEKVIADHLSSLESDKGIKDRIEIGNHSRMSNC